MSKRFIAIIICIALLVVLAGCGSSQPAEPDRIDTPVGTFEVYRNSQYGFSVQFPVDWTKPEDVPGTAIQFFAPSQDPTDSFRENLNIIVQDLGQRLTLEEYSQPYLEQLQIVADSGIQLSDVTLAGLPAKQAAFTKSVQDKSVDFRQIWTVKEQRAYILTFTSETSKSAQYTGIFTQMATSFKLGG